jgi:hypothetical protein
MNNNRQYIKGYTAELEARDLLKKEGCNLVFRSAGSKGIADLCGVVFDYKTGKVKDIRLVQIKSVLPKNKGNALKEKVKGVELWIKITRQGWTVY